MKPFLLIVLAFAKYKFSCVFKATVPFILYSIYIYIIIIYLYLYATSMEVREPEMHNIIIIIK